MVAVLGTAGIDSKTKMVPWSRSAKGHLAITPFHSWLIGACKVCVSQCPKIDLAINVDQAHVDIFNLTRGYCCAHPRSRRRFAAPTSIGSLLHADAPPNNLR